MKKTIPIFAAVLVVVAGIAFYMGQQTAVPAAPIEPPPVETPATIVHTTDTTHKNNAVTENELNNSEEYIVRYDDLDEAILSGFKLVYLESLDQPDPIEFGFEISLYEQLNHRRAWEVLGRRVPDNSEDLYRVWKNETINPEEGILTYIDDEGTVGEYTMSEEELNIINMTDEEAQAYKEQLLNDLLSSDPVEEAHKNNSEDTSIDVEVNTNEVDSDEVPGTEQSAPKFDLGEFEDPNNLYDVSGGKLTPDPIKDHNYHSGTSFN